MWPITGRATGTFLHPALLPEAGPEIVRPRTLQPPSERGEKRRVVMDHERDSFHMDRVLWATWVQRRRQRWWCR
jgi:hypothetical protein